MNPTSAIVTDAEILLADIPTACRMLGIGVTTLFQLRKTGQIKSVVIKTNKANAHGRRMFPVASLKAYVESLTEGGSDA